MRLIIILLVLYYCLLSSNPYTNKHTKVFALKYIPKEYTPSYKLISKVDDLYEINYPCILKPDVCSGNNHEVKKIYSVKEAKEYFYLIKDASPLIIAQKIHNGPYEVGVLYERHPFQKNGKIISIVQKQLDKKWKPLRCRLDGIKDPNFTHCNNRNEWITDELNEKIDKISKGIPNFYVGRYDIRFSDIEKFKKGEDIKVLELNGTMGYDLRATLIPKLSFRYIFLCLRFILVRLLVGMENVLLLNAVNPFSLIINQIKRFTKIRQCSNYHIFRPSEL